ncbi:MAG TPA: methyltransferase domain-containing protein, partial [Gammaproteobacteria bacterium]|nr:methyltransferase domain-containing protein [Gammaproteobacteria bacterium]
AVVTPTYSEAVETARGYYNSDDADNFYFHVWGGEDIHIGIYASDEEEIPRASERTVATMASRLALTPGSRVVDAGAGYGGAARWLARNAGCSVACVNLSEAQNERNRKITRAAGLDGLIDVHDASFDRIPAEDGQFDFAWSQDSLLHAGDRAETLAELDRVLKPGGEFIFTDPMQADACPADVLQPVLDRIHLKTLGSVRFYRAEAERLGWVDLGFTDLTAHLVRHYSRVRQELESRRPGLRALVSGAYIERMLRGLDQWVAAGREGHLAWGILRFRKPV